MEISLIDLLVLGAPNGKTELLDGQVLRTIRGDSIADARALRLRFAFEASTITDELIVDENDVLHVGRCHFEIDHDRIWVAIDVTIAQWKRFD